MDAGPDAPPTIIPWSRMRWLILSLIRSSSKRPTPQWTGPPSCASNDCDLLLARVQTTGEPRCCRTAGLCFVVPALFCVANCCCRGGKSQLVWSFWARQSRILASEKVSDLLPHIRGGAKDGWTLETKIKNVRRVGDPIRYCLANAKDLTLPE